MPELPPAPVPGWIPLPSSLAGVRVWGPPEEVEDEEPRSFVCEGCGAPLAFDPRRGGLACGRCDFVAPLDASREAAIGEFTEAALNAAPRGWGVERRELHCASCGADITLAEGQVAAACPFCTSAKVDLRAATEGALRPQRVLPFAKTPDEVARAARAWLGEGWLRPSDLAAVARVDRFVPVFLPYWLFDADLACDWSCDVGHHRTRTRRGSDGRTYTETYTEWRRVTGHTHVPFRHLPVIGTTKVAGLRKLTAFPFEQLVAYAPEALAGYAAHTYDRSLPEAWALGRHEMRTQAAAACEAQAGGDVRRNLELRADLQDEAWVYALLPVYVSALRYDGRTWVVLVDGAGGQVAGQRPVAWWKVYLAMGALTVPWVLLAVCVGLPGLLVGGLGLFVILFAGVLLLLGGAAAFALYRHAIEQEAL